MAEEKGKLELFLSIGLEERVASETLKNSKITEALTSDIKQAGVEKGCDKSVGNLIYSLSSRLPPSPPLSEARGYFLKLIASKKIKKPNQVDEGIKWLKKMKKFDSVEFDIATGVGQDVTAEQIVQTVKKIINTNKDELETQRYALTSKLLGDLRKELKWADGAEMKKVFDAEIEKVIGVKGEQDKAKPAPKAAPAEAKKEPQEEPDDFLMGRDIPAARNTEEQWKGHIERTAGEIRTRFPPEPNGFLHIGHAKAMNFNFGIARKQNGLCILRFDDTNPEAEKQEYIDSIKENIGWLMGEPPKQVTYASDYFPQLYQLAIKLIKKDKAYVCHQTQQEIKEFREARKESPWRNRPIEENLKLFEFMKMGMFDEGTATLRLKGDMDASNPQMWDIVAYRIKYTPHPHVGDKWCIYPSYDYTHCINDSLEDISYSLCTLEFEVRRESYYWLLDELDLYKPKVWEYSRLNLDYNVLSKRRLLRLVHENWVRGWDDPRLLTLNGLRRRGYTPEAINSFCKLVGVTRSSNNQPPSLLEHCAREALDSISNRALVIEEPLKVVLTNYPEDKVEDRDAPNNPTDLSKGNHKIPFSRVVYIEKKDFREQDSKDYFGLAPNKEVHLKYAYNITCTNIERNPDGTISHLLATVDFKSINKPSGKLSWVAEPKPGQEPAKVELRNYDHLFISKEPMKATETRGLKDWIEDLNPKSLVTVYGYADPTVAKAKPWDRFQFERLGYYVVDPDTKPGHVVCNLTCRLKAKTKNVV